VLKQAASNAPTVEAIDTSYHGSGHNNTLLAKTDKKDEELLNVRSTALHYLKSWVFCSLGCTICSLIKHAHLPDCKYNILRSAKHANNVSQWLLSALSYTQCKTVPY
jgi:hypothetical protein